MNGMSRYIKNNCKHLLRNLDIWVGVFFLGPPSACSKITKFKVILHQIYKAK